MKELTIEQKAKRYDEMSNEVKDFFDGKQKMYSDVEQTLNHLFPELKESDDERIRKAIILFFELQDDNTTYCFIPKKDILAWLEKQGEHANFLSKIQVGDKVTRNEGGVLVNISQLERVAKPRRVKPADKVEPKFHEGDWVIDKHGIVHQIDKVVENVTNHTYAYDIVGGGYFNDNTEGVRLWTIQDAKSGDVLFDGSNILLFQVINDWHNVTSYLAYSQVYSIREHFISNSDVIVPATKEQRDLLFQKMKKFGYEWDTEKKELKKIGNHHPLLSDFFKAEYERGKADVQKFAEWSEEDEMIVLSIEQIMNRASFLSTPKQMNEIRTWLKSLKQRIEE